MRVTHGIAQIDMFISVGAPWVWNSVFLTTSSTYGATVQYVTVDEHICYMSNCKCKCSLNVNVIGGTMKGPVTAVFSCCSDGELTVQE